MTIEYNGEVIPGWHDEIVVGPPRVKSRVADFFGLDGVAEIRGGYGDRQLSCMIWLTDKTWVNPIPDQLYTKLNELDQLVNQDNADLIMKLTNGTVLRTFEGCTFHGFQPQQFEGQPDPSPVRDYAGTLHDYQDFATTGGAWVLKGRLTWMQPAPLEA